jgi:signal transduction histidine kinase
VAKDGRVLSVDASVSPIRDGKGAVIGAATITRDLTQMKMAEQALRNSEKLAVAGRMAATVAHEINGPLEAVANILFLLDRAELTQTAQEFVRAAQEEVKRIGQITKLTLGFHREGEQQGTAEVVASDLIDGILTLYGVPHRVSGGRYREALRQRRGCNRQRRGIAAGALQPDRECVRGSREDREQAPDPRL